ncbi:MAG: DUF3046 domain-containing protein [Actinomycetota bacterium]|nr:DUF3046 domain-containing protein [Actinomycetota bacterium]
MRRSEFMIAVADEFGEAYGQVLLHDLHLADVGGRTAREALSAGVPPREVWLALCRAKDVPPNRWHGVGKPEPKR